MEGVVQLSAGELQRFAAWRLIYALLQWIFSFPYKPLPRFLTFVCLFALGLFERKAVLSLKVDLTVSNAQGDSEIIFLTPNL